MPWALSLLLLCLSACSSLYKPCSTGGQSPYDSASLIPKSIPGGTKRCGQKVNDDGKTVNDGKYFEWYADDKIAITGQYENGRKTGHWIEYDSDGNKLSERYFEKGKEVEAP